MFVFIKKKRFIQSNFMSLNFRNRFFVNFSRNNAFIYFNLGYKKIRFQKFLEIGLKFLLYETLSSWCLLYFQLNKILNPHFLLQHMSIIQRLDLEHVTG